MLNSTRIAGFAGTMLFAVVSDFQNFTTWTIAHPVMADGAKGSQSSSPCIECIRIRVGPPRVREFQTACPRNPIAQWSLPRLQRQRRDLRHRRSNVLGY